MMSGKSLPSVNVLEKNKSNNSLSFNEDLEMEIVSFF